MFTSARLRQLLSFPLARGLSVFAVLAFVGAQAGAAPYAPETYSTAQLKGQFEACSDLFPSGRAPAVYDRTQWRTRELCSDTFAVLHSGLSKTPLYVVEKLTVAQLKDAKGESRSDDFFPDPRLPANARAHLDDYARSGYDRGHLAPAADQPNSRAMVQSFALSNMVPQAPVNNRKVWSKLESDVRKYALRANGPVYVFSGPLFAEPVQALGRSQVWIPQRLFKLVYDPQARRAWAHVLPNTDDARLGPPMSYADFVQATGLNLLPSLTSTANSQ